MIKLGIIYFFQNRKVRNSQIQSPKLIHYTVQSTETERTRSEDEVTSHTLMLFYFCRYQTHHLYGHSLILFHLSFVFYDNSQTEFVHR